MPIDWKSNDAIERFLVAWWVSHGRPDLTKIAEAYGRGATYHSVENFSRKIKVQADKRKKEMEEEKLNGTSNVGTPPSKPRAPKKKSSTVAGSGVASGYIQKRPTKRSAKLASVKVKTEDRMDLKDNTGALDKSDLTPGAVDGMETDFENDYGFDLGSSPI